MGALQWQRLLDREFIKVTVSGVLQWQRLLDREFIKVTVFGVLQWLVSYLLGILSQVNHKGYIMTKNNVQSVSYLLCTQVIKPQIIHKPQNLS